MTQRWPLPATAVLLATLALPLPRPAAAQEAPEVLPSGLFDYVKKDDPGFRWTVAKSEKMGDGKVTVIRLTSQVWQGIPWNHTLTICEPADLKYPGAALLFITGGNIKNMDRPDDANSGMALARLCGARVAVLPQVPNQPLLGDKTEDTLIAETFVRYLDTGDDNWPLLFPMVKSAVRAMDAVQQWAQRDGKPAVTRFMVTGASKRGWTTWLTAVADPRVVAIAPMVIDTLNMRAQSDHAIEVWGKPSEQIHDYVERGLLKKTEEPRNVLLWKTVDPYTYRDRLTLPKLIINGANDRYWTVDALNLYWDALKGQKYVVYLPNAGHNLAVNRDYALNGIGAFFRHNLSNRPMPTLTWEHSDAGDRGLRLSVTSNPPPKSARLWVARSDTRDFRESTWESKPLDVTGSVARGEVDRPAKGSIALMGDLEYEIDSVPYHLSTQIREAAAKGKD